MAVGINYGKGVIFVILFLLLCLIVGSAIYPKKSAPYRAITGYIVYCALVAIVGIPVQVFQLNWAFFYYYVLVLDIVLFIISLWRIKKNRISVWEGNLITFVANYWFVLIISLLATFLLCFYGPEMWYGNITDDSYYIVRMATAPFLKNTSVITGLSQIRNIFDLRNTTTFEIESSVYIHLLNMPATLYARVFLSFINYFIFANTIYAFADFIYKKGQLNIDKKYIQFSCIALTICDFDTARLAIHHIINYRDGWMINHAMYYGCALILTVSFIWLLIPLLETKKINYKTILTFLITSFVLMTKSNVALPLIVASLIAFIFYNGIKNIKFLLIFTLMLMVISMLVRRQAYYLFIGYMGNAGNYYNHIIDNYSSIIGIFFIMAIILITYKYKKKLLNFSILWLCLTLVFLLPPFNTIIVAASQYHFVYYRGIAGLMWFTITYAVILINFILYRILKLDHKLTLRTILFLLLAFCIGGTSVLAIEKKPANVKYDLVELKENPYFTPQIVTDLANKLHNLDRDKKMRGVCAAIPNWLYLTNTRHRVVFSNRVSEPHIMLGGSIRMFDDSIEIPTMNWKEDISTSNGKFNKIKIDDINAVNTFIDYPNESNFNKVQRVIDRYPFNCFVVKNVKTGRYLERIGFSYYDSTIKWHNYKLYIYYKD